jgi:PTS system fructose-specific IIC component
MGILDKLTEQNIKVPLTASSKDEVLHELIEVLKKSGIITSEREAYEAVVNRERQGSTGLGEEVAIPHAKTTAVSDIAMVVGVSPKGIDFQSLDGKPVKIFFLILANPEYASAHIEALSEVAKVTRNKAFCRQLISAESAREVIEIFQSDS